MELHGAESLGQADPRAAFFGGVIEVEYSIAGIFRDPDSAVS